ncbi:hypothetical protein LMH66_19500 [Shewanella sp. 10N.7]|uniref:hypothetical protein n=1 Tax=Shewanella sp. 10N.7 TaxID=2885093 RepID=UPI001E5F1388|nr:hypothetical protein [Shewanella sp. 10N.7]MCC4834834.1 hypothetical protein [Shewanella sp. 10N.7]
MSKSVNATLLNAFVCPGVGHLYLGKKAIGWSIIAACFVSLCAIMTVVMQRAQAIADDIVAGNIPLDFYSIYDAVHQSVTTNLPASLDIAVLVLLICWIGGSISAYIMGKKIDDANKPSNQ